MYNCVNFHIITEPTSPEPEDPCSEHAVAECLHNVNEQFERRVCEYRTEPGTKIYSPHLHAKHACNAT